MFNDYLRNQIKKASYEFIDQGQRYYGEIKFLSGVWATGKTMEECRENLLSTLEGWVFLRLRKNLSIPGFSLKKNFSKKPKSKMYA